MKNYQIIGLDWDTNFFGIPSCKVILNKEQTEKNFEMMISEIMDYQFVTINNVDNNPKNNYLLGNNTASFFVDMNYQFEKKSTSKQKIDESIQLFNNEEKILKELEDLASRNFEYSRFFNDPKLDSTKANQVYSQWVQNAANDLSKNIIYYSENGKAGGFLVYSIENGVGILELISVDRNMRKKKVGTKLLNAFETFCQNNILRVGTQADNIRAIQFYIKNGYRLVSRHSIYHLWEQNYEKD